ncbi:MAG TPA: 16S rRNA (guanine(966)-N(2))-methyltransferase RsmD [Actinomycetota bacterium]|jgi:16S rRNA (guanine966-N2)-methyltransferase
MRVVAGSAKGTRLAPVPAGTRPVSDRAREGLFSSLGGAVENARVLDLFAGTGALGIEALSRGAATAVFVDSAPAAVKIITENLRRTKLWKSAGVRRMDAVRSLRTKLGQFDLVLLDPPYRLPDRSVDELLGTLAGGGALAAGAIVALTRARGSYMPVIPLDWREARRLSYGDSLVLVFQAP